MGGSEAKRMERKSRTALLENVLAKEKDDRLRTWLRVQLLGERQVAVAKELGYSSSAGIYQTVRRLEEQRVNNRILDEKLNGWTQMCNVVG
jgi:hypothetical protein